MGRAPLRLHQLGRRPGVVVPAAAVTCGLTCGEYSRARQSARRRQCRKATPVLSVGASGLAWLRLHWGRCDGGLLALRAVPRADIAAAAAPAQCTLPGCGWAGWAAVGAGEAVSCLPGRGLRRWAQSKSADRGREPRGWQRVGGRGMCQVCRTERAGWLGRARTLCVDNVILLGTRTSLGKSGGHVRVLHTPYNMTAPTMAVIKHRCADTARSELLSPVCGRTGSVGPSAAGARKDAERQRPRLRRQAGSCGVWAGTIAARNVLRRHACMCTEWVHTYKFVLTRRPKEVSVHASEDCMYTSPRMAPTQP